MSRIPTRDLRSAEHFNAFYFTPALANGASLSSLFSTHPPLQKRLDQLAKLEAEMNQARMSARRRRARPAAGRRRLMGLFDTLLGRTKPVRANLDALFALPSAAVTLQVDRGPGADRQGRRLLQATCRPALRRHAGRARAAPGDARRPARHRTAGTGRRRHAASAGAAEPDRAPRRATVRLPLDPRRGRRDRRPRHPGPHGPLVARGRRMEHRSCCARSSASPPVPPAAADAATRAPGPAGRRPTPSPGPSTSSTWPSRAPSIPSPRRATSSATPSSSCASRHARQRPAHRGRPEPVVPHLGPARRLTPAVTAEVGPQAARHGVGVPGRRARVEVVEAPHTMVDEAVGVERARRVPDQVQGAGDRTRRRRTPSDAPAARPR